MKWRKRGFGCTLMKILIKIFFGLILLLICITIYANFLHPLFFFTRQDVSYDKRFALKEGSEVSFKSGKNTIKGWLKIPKDLNRRIPAIIFCVGSGGQSSYGDAFYSKFLDTLFEQNLPKDSIAFLYFDKRGVGKSEGKWYNTDFEQRAEDVKAGADYLKSLSFIDSSKIIVAGHSQGGWIAQICLSKYPQTFSGGISMAGPTFGVKEQVINDYTSAMMCQEGLTESNAREKALKKVNFDFLFTSFFPFRQEWKQLAVVKKFEPSKYLATIKKPLLLMFCENDALVSPKYSFIALNKLYPNGPPSNFQTVIIKGANHAFKLADLCYSVPYTNVHFSEQAQNEIYYWVKSWYLNNPQ
jgi:dipeptidyl aminopeptidase/acylaminoacyl peptidase